LGAGYTYKKVMPSSTGDDSTKLAMNNGISKENLRDERINKEKYLPDTKAKIKDHRSRKNKYILKKTSCGLSLHNTCVSVD
jgi:hypothetical protein